MSTYELADDIADETALDAPVAAAELDPLPLAAAFKHEVEEPSPMVTGEE